MDKLERLQDDYERYKRILERYEDLPWEQTDGLTYSAIKTNYCEALTELRKEQKRRGLPIKNHDSDCGDER